MPAKRTDLELLALINGEDKQQSDAAFEELCINYTKVIKYYASKVKIKGYDKYDLEQEFRIVLLFAAKKFVAEKSESKRINVYFRRMIQTKIDNLIHKQNVKKRGGRTVSLDEVREDDNNLYVCTPDPDDLVKEYDIAEEYSHLERQLLEQLTKIEEDVYIYHCKQGNNMEETMILTGLDFKSIDNALQRIKTKAKQIYNKDKDKYYD